MSDERLLLDNYLKSLKLPTIRGEYKALARKCSQANAAYKDFLQQLAELEVQHRTAAAIECRLRQAGFPMVKEMSLYKFADVPKLNKKYVLDLVRCQFIETKTNLVLTGPPGVGKTYLAIAFGREACRRGYKVKFFTTSQLVNTYIEARQERMILKIEKNIQCCNLIIINELKPYVKQVNLYLIMSYAHYFLAISSVSVIM